MFFSFLGKMDGKKWMQIFLRVSQISFSSKPKIYLFSNSTIRIWYDFSANISAKSYLIQLLPRSKSIFSHFFVCFLYFCATKRDSGTFFQNKVSKIEKRKTNDQRKVMGKTNEVRKNVCVGNEKKEEELTEWCLKQLIPTDR